jgi:hypothetical protein
MNIELLVTLWAGHYLADFPLQPAFVAEKKALVFIESIGFHCLTAHAFIHGLVAGMITQNFGAGVAVGLTHWAIDFGKSSKLLKNLPHTKGARNQFQDTGFYGINVDQMLHFLVIALVAWRLS